MALSCHYFDNKLIASVTVLFLLQVQGVIEIISILNDICLMY